MNNLTMPKDIQALMKSPTLYFLLLIFLHFLVTEQKKKQLKEKLSATTKEEIKLPHCDSFQPVTIKKEDKKLKNKLSGRSVIGSK